MDGRNPLSEVDRCPDGSVRVASDDQPGMLGRHVQTKDHDVAIGADLRQRAWPLVESLSLRSHCEYPFALARNGTNAITIPQTRPMSSQYRERVIATTGCCKRNA